MTTFTACMLIGSPGDGGLIPERIAWLAEGHRPTWILEPAGLHLTGGDVPSKLGRAYSLYALVPEAPEHILADGLLLAALHTPTSADLRRVAGDLIPELIAPPVDGSGRGHLSLSQQCADRPGRADISPISESSRSTFPGQARLDGAPPVGDRGPTADHLPLPGRDRGMHPLLRQHRRAHRRLGAQPRRTRAEARIARAGSRGAER